MIFTQNDHPYLHPCMFHSLIRFTVIGTRRASGHYYISVSSGAEGQFERRGQLPFCRSVITCILYAFHVRLNHAGQQTLQQKHCACISTVFRDGDSEVSLIFSETRLVFTMGSMYTYKVV